MGRYSNPLQQGEVLAELLQIVPSRSQTGEVRTPKQIHRRLRPDQAEALAKAYRAGSTTYELAETFGIHRETVSLILQRLGIPRRNPPLSPEQVAQAISLYNSGQSLAAVGKRLGHPPSTVWNALKLAGVPIRRRNGWNYA